MRCACSCSVHTTHQLSVSLTLWKFELHSSVECFLKPLTRHTWNSAQRSERTMSNQPPAAPPASSSTQTSEYKAPLSERRERALADGLDLLLFVGEAQRAEIEGVTRPTSVVPATRRAQVTTVQLTSPHKGIGLGTSKVHARRALSERLQLQPSPPGPCSTRREPSGCEAPRNVGFRANQCSRRSDCSARSLGSVSV